MGWTKEQLRAVEGCQRRYLASQVCHPVRWSIMEATDPELVAAMVREVIAVSR